MTSQFEIIRSKRRTLALEITQDARLLVRAPLHTSNKQIEVFISAHDAWIQRKLADARKRAAAFDALNPEKITNLRKQAEKILPQKTACFAAVMGLTYSRVRITDAKSRFGSCGRNGNICYSWRLMLYPDAAQDYVVVHELCHLLHFNHSGAFYAALSAVLPDYKARAALLKELPETKAL